jgi:2-methylisocitrate lyase-like PEP mutase family enzyme
MAIPSLQSVLAQGQMIAPDTFDGISTRAAETLGCKTALLSASALTHTVHGTPDEGTLNVTEMVWSLTRFVEDNCNIPLIVEVRSGFSDNLRIMPYDLERVVKAGAAAMLLDDRIYGCGNDSPEVLLVSPEVFARKVAIAVKAAENTDCMILARSFSEDKEDAIARCKAAQEAGAQIVGAACMRTEEDAEYFAQKVEGAKLWSDLTVKDQKVEVTAEKLEELGYGLVFITFMEKGAWFGDLDYGTKNFANKNTVYADLHDFDGYLRAEDGSLRDYHYIFSYWKKWMPLEKRLQDLSVLGDDAWQEGKR